MEKIEINFFGEGFALIRKLSFAVSVVFIFALAFPSFCCAKGYVFKDLLNQSFETNRLILQPKSESDLQTLANYLLDKDVTKFLDVTTAEKGFETREEALQFLKNKENSQITSCVDLTIILKSSHLPIGQLSAMFFGDKIVSFSYWLGKDFWNRGYASEACFELCNKVFNADDVRVVSIYCFAENKPSYKLACKILDYLENNNKASFKLNREEKCADLKYNSLELVIKGLILQKVGDCP